MVATTRKRSPRPFARLRILVVDVGGTHVKLLASGARTARRFESGPAMTPRRMVTGVRRAASDWAYDVVSIGFPGVVMRGKPIAEPHNLGRGWVGFDYAKAFGRPVRVINDAAMQALGSYRRGRMLFLGLGTGLGTAMVDEGRLEPMELAHLPYRKATYEDYVGARGLERRGRKKWQRDVGEVVERLVAALEPDEVVLGGGNARKLTRLPRGCRLGSNANAFRGGFRLWSSGRSDRAPAANRGRARGAP
ncbi:MAG: ROK family protein [Gaiellaceae bacterium]